MTSLYQLSLLSERNESESDHMLMERQEQYYTTREQLINHWNTLIIFHVHSL